MVNKGSTHVEGCRTRRQLSLLHHTASHPRSLSGQNGARHDGHRSTDRSVSWDAIAFALAANGDSASSASPSLAATAADARAPSAALSRDSGSVEGRPGGSASAAALAHAASRIAAAVTALRSAGERAGTTSEAMTAAGSSGAAGHSGQPLSRDQSVCDVSSGTASGPRPHLGNQAGGKNPANSRVSGQTVNKGRGRQQSRVRGCGGGSDGVAGQATVQGTWMGCTDSGQRARDTPCGGCGAAARIRGR